jgi:hypothetical protein
VRRRPPPQPDGREASHIRPSDISEIDWFLLGNYFFAGDREGEHKARQQLAKLLMSDAPLSRGTRAGLACLFSPFGELRVELVYEPLQWTRDDQIAVYVVKRQRAGVRRKPAIIDATRRYGVTRATVYRALQENEHNAKSLVAAEAARRHGRRPVSKSDRKFET